MLISGLWKLAAMSGVVGVGLFAVYQAHKGMDKQVVTAEESDRGDRFAQLDTETTRPFPVEDSGDDADPSEPSQGDPFDKPSPVRDVAPAKAKAGKVKAGNVKAAEPLNDEWADEEPISPPPKRRETAKQTKAPALDFRDDAEAVDEKPVPKGTLRKEPDPRIDFAADEQIAQPGRIPDDLDAIEADVRKSQEKVHTKSTAKKPPKPYTRQAREEVVKVADSDFEDNQPPSQIQQVGDRPAELPQEADPVGTNVNSPREKDPFDLDAAPAIDAGPRQQPPADFGGSIPPQQQSSTGDPIETMNLDTPPPSVPTLGRPTDLKRITDDPGAPSIDDAAPIEDPPKSAPRRRPVDLRLPTEIPDPIDSVPPQNPGDFDPSLNPRRLPSSDPITKTSNDDFQGDGTVLPGAPRGVQQPRITIEKIAPQQGMLGEPVIYKIVVKNVGGVPAHHVVIEDQIPKGIELRDTQTAPVAEMIDKKLTWKIGTLKPNEEKKISIRVIPRHPGTIGSVARVIFATEVAAEISVTGPQLSFTANAPKQVRVGEPFQMTFFLKNAGSATATNVSVRDLVPEGLKHEADSDIKCPIGTLPPGEAREIVLPVVAVKPGRFKNLATLMGDNGINQELETIIDVVGEHIAITRTGNNRIYVNRAAVFTNSVKNEGNTEVERVRVAEIIPIGMEFDSADAGATFDPVGRSIQWTVGPLRPGDTAQVSARLVPKAAGSQQSRITATSSSGTTVGVKAAVEVVGMPQLQIETVSSTGQIQVGDRLTSKIQLSNQGTATASNVGLTIRLPQELKLIEVVGSRYVTVDNGIALDSVPPIGPNQKFEFKIILQAISEADTELNLEISADHLKKPVRRTETVQILPELR